LFLATVLVGTSEQTLVLLPDLFDLPTWLRIAQLVLALRMRADADRREHARQLEESRRTERQLIAREMHEVLAHRISLLSVHAGALEARLAPHVVLMDVRMPALDGVTATVALGRRAAGHGPRPAVVMLTTFDADETVLAALRAGAAGFLVRGLPGQGHAARADRRLRAARRRR
jgi:CheY-like chemotaxis protein